MHISEGVLSAPILLGGAALAVGGLIRGLKTIDQDDIPKAAILSAVFFTASLIHIKIGVSSTHLVLSGLIGLLMGWAAFPIIFLGLLLQGLLFSFGGLTTLGLNTFNMAAPAVLIGIMLRKGINSPNKTKAMFSGFICGGFPILVSALLVALALYESNSSFLTMAITIVISNLPVMIIEALVAMFCVQFLRKVRPEILKHSLIEKPELINQKKLVTLPEVPNALGATGSALER